jgi:colanic acid/amylovoran biosynthesis glycosyltransferase
VPGVEVDESRQYAEVMLTVVYITGRFPGRSETFIERQIRGVAQAGAQVKVLCMDQQESGEGAAMTVPGIDAILGAPQAQPGRWGRLMAMLQLILRRRLPWMQMARLFPRALTDPHACYFTYFAMAEGLRACEPFDIAHAQFGHLGRLVAALKDIGMVDRPLVTAFRGGDTTIALKRDAAMYQELYRRGERFLAVSQHLRDLHIQAGCEPSKISVHHSGLDLKEWPFRFRECGSPLRVLTVGRLVGKKGTSDVIEAVSQLKERNTDIHLDIIGDGPLMPQLKQLAEDRELHSQVTFHGWKNRSELMELYSNAGVLVAASVTGEDGDMEGIPNVLKEAMALGLPVVATRHGGIPELVKDGETGILVDEHDVDGIAAGIRHIVDHTDKASRRGGKARQLIEEAYDIQILSQSLMTEYQSIVSTPE